jgi:oligopeptide transport system substrate-binding protein
MWWRQIFAVFLACYAAAAPALPVLNNPHGPEEAGKKVLYSVFSSRPKHLDPLVTYNLDDSAFIDQIYEPPLEYHYLKRPYQLQPLTLTQMPLVEYLDARGRAMSRATARTVYSRYTFNIKPGIMYQPHPAFAKNAQGEPVYQCATAVECKAYKSFSDFDATGTKELTANDYIYQIKRMADPSLQMPIWDLVSHYIVGLSELRDDITTLRAQYPGQWINLDDFLLSGVEQQGKYQFTLTLRGVYPQFKYWLAFHFFAPIPMEVDRFYHQPGLAEKNISLDFYPVGTGPYMMTKQNVNEEIVLERNPNYHDDFYPLEGDKGDLEKGLLKDVGKKLPFIDKVSFRMENEAIPIWTKFLQGYYDRSGISSDSFDQAVNVTVEGIGLSEDMQKKGVRLNRSLDPATYYLGFNMLDNVVGGLDDKHRKLRQAIAIAYDQQEYISIFNNGRGEVANSPIPPGIFGYRITKDKNHSIEEAKRLLAEAGYPGGRDAKTGKPLVLNLDTTTGGNADSARNTWLMKQFQKIDVQLNIRATDYNRFQEKMEKGNAQIYFWGWFADYPDPENFLFLLYGPNGRVGSGGSGVNSSNYNNPQYNVLFDQMKNMEDTPQRLAIIQNMLAIVDRDVPWASAFHPQSFVLNNAWVSNYKPHGISKANLKYQNIDETLRQQKRAEWNQPVLWPLICFMAFVLIVTIPGYRAYQRRLQRKIQ